MPARARAAAPTGKATGAAPSKKAGPANKSSTASKPATAKKAPPREPAKPTVPAKAATPAKKAASAATKAPAGKAAAGKKTAPAGKTAPAARTAAPAKTAPAARTAAPAKKAAPSAKKAAPKAGDSAKKAAAKAARAEQSAAQISVPKGTEWTAAELAEVRSELVGELAAMQSEYDRSIHDLNELQLASADGAGDDQADAGSKTFEREQELSIAANRLDLLTQIQRAVERIDAGTYGFCESCGQPIPKARLKAFPMATLDVACKQREERR